LGSGKAYRFFLTQASITIDNPNGYGTSLDDQFGSSVAISESYAIIGAFREDDDGGTSAGKAYIYNNVTGALLWTLDNPNAYGTSGANRFGLSVAISESYAIAGAHLEDDDAGGNSGKAYIFNPNTGSLLWTLDNPNGYSTSLDDYFGYDVDISESYAIVGAYKEDDASGTESGKAYIFDPSTGELLWTLDNPNAYGTSADDNFGYSVSISESYAIVGAYAEDGDGVVISGKAYIFNSSTGVLLWTLDNPNAYDLATRDYFGRSVSISESYAIVGADEENDVGGIESGKAYIFDPSTGDLLWTLDNPNAYSVSAIDTFGFDV